MAEEGQLITKSNDPYYELVAHAGSMTQKFCNSTLDFYYSLGKDVDKLLSAPAKYGERRIDTFAEDLQAYNTSLKKDMLYNARKFATAMSKEDIAMAKAAHISFRRVLHLCKGDITEEIRAAVLSEAQEYEEAKQDGSPVYDVAAAVEDRVPGAPADSSKPPANDDA